MGLALASIVTLLLLSGFLLVAALPVLLTVSHFFGVSGYLIVGVAVGLTILGNAFMWLISPWIADLIYRHFYNLEWISIRELRDRRPETAAFVETTCETYGFDVPKLGFIPDRNPNAFTYGSGRWNSRVVVTEGMFEYLDPEELTAVYAHELGHVQHRDFIVMTIASTLLQLIFEFYAWQRDRTYAEDESAFDFQLGRTSPARSAGSSDDREDGQGQQVRNLLLVVTILAYVLYRLGTYTVLYLSRLREYYADEFAAEEADPNQLSSALLKTAYGILASPDNVRQVQSAKLIGLTDFELAKNVGLVYFNTREQDDTTSLSRSLLYDVVNPWAFVTELRSTHPLPGKRIRRLSRFADDPLFDFEAVRRDVSVDRRRLYRGFFRDIGAVYGPSTAVFALPLVYFGLDATSEVPVAIEVFLGGWIALVGTTVVLRTLYAFPRITPEPTSVLELMGDLYASPVRGRSVELRGELVGRGIPGLIVSEDMLIEDDTGLMFVNYEGLIPLLGGLFFGLRRVPKLIGQPVEITGWFRRGSSQWVGLRRLVATNESVNGFVRTGGLIGGGVLLFLGLALPLVLQTSF